MSGWLPRPTPFPRACKHAPNGLIEGTTSEIAGLQEQALSYHYLGVKLYLDMKYRPPERGQQ
jgi:hypothetical protein